MASEISIEVLEIVVVSMRDAFLAVTVFIAAMVLLFSWLQYVTAGRFVDRYVKIGGFNRLLGL